MTFIIGGLVSLAFASIIAVVLVRARRQQRNAEYDEEAHRRLDEETKLRAIEKAHQVVEQEARRKAEAEACGRADDEVRVAAEQEATRKAEEETRQTAEQEARRNADAEARRRVDDDARVAVAQEVQRNAEKTAQLAAEREARRKTEVEARHRVEEQVRVAAEQDAHRRTQEESRVAAEQDAQHKAQEETRRRTEEEVRLVAEQEVEGKAEGAAQLAEKEARRKAEAEALRRTEEEVRVVAQQEAERKAEQAVELAATQEARRKVEDEVRRRTEEEACLAAEQEAGRKAEDAQLVAESNLSDSSSAAESASELELILDFDNGMGETEAAESDEGEVSLQSADVTSQGLRPKQPAVHRDRRGKRRASTSAAQTEPGSSVARPPAEARLRLSLHPIRRTAGLSLVLMRPEGFPPHVSLRIDGQTAIDAYDEQRYDDVSVPWRSDLLSGELRVSSAEGFEWLRSARRVQIFAPDANEPGLMTVAAARAGVAHAIICRSDDVPAVREIAESAGSTNLKSCNRFEGIPEGWAVLSEYVPTRAAESIREPGLRPLDPGYGIAIELEGGLAIWPKVFAEGHPPKIKIEPLPEGVSVRIGGQQAVRDIAGGWEAPGWETPGQHTIDVTPGPSVTYEIMADPAHGDQWSFWNAHQSRFSRANAPWSLAEICGATITGPAHECVFAAETQPTMIVLEARRGTVALQHRTGVGVSMALLSEAPAFLLVSSGQRRHQGKIVWLGGALPAPNTMRADSTWAAAVVSAVSRRLPLEGGAGDGGDAWRKALTAVRTIRKRRR